jgi:cellulose synthase/poly-beta-1,6-N-acetylglucosamine synthase-like glycosyltransferase
MKIKKHLAFLPLIVFLIASLLVLGTGIYQQRSTRLTDPLTAERPLNRWFLPGDSRTQMTIVPVGRTLNIDVNAPKATGRYAPLTNQALSFVPGQRYTLTFRGHSGTPRRIVAGVQWSSDWAPRREVSESAFLLGGDWATYHYTFVASRAWGNAYFELGRTYGDMALDSIVIESGTPDLPTQVLTLFSDNAVFIGLLLTLTLAPILLYKQSIADQRIILPSLIVLCLMADYFWWRTNVTHWSLLWLGVPLLFADTLSNIPLLALLLTFWPRSRQKAFVLNPTIDPYTMPIFILIPTVNEGVEVLEATILGALATQKRYQQDHPESIVRIVVCNDGKVGKYAQWKEVENLAIQMGVECVTRTIPGGAKAGNIENTRKVLDIVGESIVVIFDADQVAHVDFLEKVVSPFADPRVAWVQTPQRYRNLENPVARWANEQQAFFYDVICPERARVNAATICGTNVAIRASALDSIGGFPLTSVTEDSAASLLLHPTWQGIYLSEYLTDGLGPMDMDGFIKQQRRWAVGMLELLFYGLNPKKCRLDFLQWTQYMLAGLHYLRGLRDALLFIGPIIFLLTGYSAVVSIDFLSLAKHILPLFAFSQFLLWFWLGGKMTWRTVLLGFGSFPVYLEAFWKVITRGKVAFEVTPKQRKAQAKSILFSYYLAIALGVISLLSRITQPLTIPIFITMLCVLYGLSGLFSMVYLHRKTLIVVSKESATQKVEGKEKREKETVVCAP